MISCRVSGCTKVILCKDVCSTHYDRLRRLGRTYLVPGEQGKRHNYIVTPIEERFWAKIRKTNNHWFWTGGKTLLGYGSLWDYERKGGVMAHRLSWELANGKKIPKELHIDHLCRTPSCVNPNHIEPVTRKVNAQRGVAGLRAKERSILQTHCKNGHLRKGNIFKSGGCKTCGTDSTRRRRARIKAQGVIKV